MLFDNNKLYGRDTLAYTDVGKKLAIVCEDGTVSVFSIISTRNIVNEFVVSDGNRYKSADFSSNGNLLILCYFLLQKSRFIRKKMLYFI